MKNKQHLTTNFITPFFVAEGLGMRLILILLLSSATIHYTKAQTITSLLTQTTTDLLKGDVRNGFSWKNMTYSLLSSNIYAKRGDEPDETCNANNIGAIGYGSCSYCLGPEGYGDYDISYQCTPTGWHETGRQKKQTVLVGGGGSSGGNTGNGPPTGTPSNNDKPDDWYPPSVPTEPIDINGGGGAIGTPWQPNENPNNNNHNPTKPTKPVTTLSDDDQPIIKKDTAIKIDTVSATKITCDSLIKSIDSITSKLVDSLAKLQRWKELHDTAYYGNQEIGMSAYDSSGIIKEFKRSNNAANNQQIGILIYDTTQGINHKNIVLTAHPHYKDLDAIPDCGDLYALMLPRILKNNFLNHSFIICGDTAIDLAVTINDTTAIRTFLTLYLRDSAIHFRDTAANGSLLNPEWSMTYKGEFGDSLSLGQEFDKAIEKLTNKRHYPEKLIWTYAQVYMLQKYNMGIRFSQSTNGGKYHALGANIKYDINGELEDIEITICQ